MKPKTLCDIMHVLRLGFFGWVNVMDYNHIACNDTSKCATYDLNYHIINPTSMYAIHDSIEKNSKCATYDLNAK